MVTIFFPLSLVLDEKTCSDPGGPLNGYRRVVEDTGLLNGRYAKNGTVIAFFCNNSYVLSGNEQRTCQDDGEWSGKQPICIKGSLQSFFYHSSQKLLWFYWILFYIIYTRQTIIFAKNKPSDWHLILRLVVCQLCWLLNSSREDASDSRRCFHL